jgi:hypothetical protein
MAAKIIEFYFVNAFARGWVALCVALSPTLPRTLFAVYTQKRDVTQRLKEILKAGMQVCICHPRLVATGMDYVEYGDCQTLFS